MAITLGNGFHIDAGTAIDDRIVVGTKTELLSLSTFQNIAYDGLVVCVKNNGEGETNIPQLWMLRNAKPYNTGGVPTENDWVLVGGATDDIVQSCLTWVMLDSPTTEETPEEDETPEEETSEPQP